HLYSSASPLFSSSRCPHGDLHSFPTRRSSDLLVEQVGGILQSSLCRHIGVRGVADTGANDTVFPGRLGHRFQVLDVVGQDHAGQDRKSTRLNSSHVSISYAVFCLKKKNQSRSS